MEESNDRQDGIDEPDSEDDQESFCEKQVNVCFSGLCLSADF